jgi:arylsulfatase A-like enzyme
MDTVRADHLSCYGYYRSTSPAIDHIAKEGVLFSNAFTPMAHTLPAHVSLFTSRYPLEHMVLQCGWKIQKKLPHLAETLKASNYSTGGIIGAAVLKKETGLGLGFDFYDDYFDKYTILGGKKSKIELFRKTADQVVERAIDLIKKQYLNRPFFLFLHFYDAHTKYALIPEKYQKMFPKDPELTRILKERNQNPKFAKMINKYDGGIRYIDDSLTRFWSFLKKTGIYDSSFIIIVSDHGEGLGEHNYYYHGRNVYEEQMRVPMIIRFPRGDHAGKRVDQMVTLLDVFPSILDFLGIPELPYSSGKSFLGLIRGKTDHTREYVHYERRWYPEKKPKGTTNWESGQKFGVRGKRWKYIWHSERSAQLYDLEIDPHELNNIAPHHPDKAAAMEKELEHYKKLVKKNKVFPQEIDQETKEQLESLGYLH